MFNQWRSFMKHDAKKKKPMKDEAMKEPMAKGMKETMAKGMKNEKHKEHMHKKK